MPFSPYLVRVSDLLGLAPASLGFDWECNQDRSLTAPSLIASPEAAWPLGALRKPN